MDLSPKTTVTTPVRDKTWLGSQHGTDSPRTCTLDIAGGSFAGVIVTGGLPDGSQVVPSGTPIVRGVDELYDLATGVGVAADGHLFEDVVINSATTAAGGAFLWHAVVVEAEVPGTFVADNHAAHVLYV